VEEIGQEKRKEKRKDSAVAQRTLRNAESEKSFG